LYLLDFFVGEGGKEQLWGTRTPSAFPPWQLVSLYDKKRGRHCQREECWSTKRRRNKKIPSWIINLSIPTYLNSTVPRTNLTIGQRAFSHSSPVIWNVIPLSARDAYVCMYVCMYIVNVFRILDASEDVCVVCRQRTSTTISWQQTATMTSLNVRLSLPAIPV